MALPNDWNGVNWQQSVIILPDMTEGYPTVVINSQQYPQYPRGYFMMAYRNAQSMQAVGYNAAEVGGAGQLVSEFVFMHEVGHHFLGHTGGLQAGALQGITYTGNKELDADRHACTHWLNRGDMHGLSVVEATMKYFSDQGNAAGDAEHPPPATRRLQLLQLVQGRQLRSFTIHNDDVTKPVFVREVLAQVFGFSLFDPVVSDLVSDIERTGSVTLYSKANGRLIERNEADRIMSFVSVRKKFADQKNFTMTCHSLP
jgi:hypothetical protein